MRWWNANESLKRIAALASYCAYHIKEHPTTLVASTGRSGSTMLARSLMASQYQLRWNSRLKPRLVFFPAFKRTNNNFIKGGVYKTHLLSSAFQGEIKKIFVFDDPIMSSISFNKCCEIYGEQWGETHLKNLESRYTIEDAFKKNIDLLNFENQINSWKNSPNTLCVKFESVWEKNREINDFLGFDLDLPEKIERKTKLMEGKLNGKDDECRRLKELYIDLPELWIN